MELLLSLFMGTPVWIWLVFIAVVLALLVFDLGVLHNDSKEIGVRESLMLSAMHISLGLLFSLFVWWQLAATPAAGYLTAFAVERTLSMDNVFVIALIFSSFALPRAYQHRVLFWGILGVIVLRGNMIGVGATLVAEYHWILYIFAAFQVAAGVRMLMIGENERNIEGSVTLGLLAAGIGVSLWKTRSVAA